MYKKKKSKKPSEYQTLRIRVPSEFEIDKLLEPLDKVRAHLNSSRSSDDKMWMKNHVLLKAIEVGLNNLAKTQKPQKQLSP